jgi:hypothetical protein
MRHGLPSHHQVARGAALRGDLAIATGRAFVLASWSVLKAGVYNVALSTVLLVLK